MAITNYLIIQSHLNRKEISKIFKKIYINPKSDCWEWLGYKNTAGYGRYHVAHKPAYTHRMMYAWIYGPIPTGRGRNVPVVDHICKNKSCCNPAHLQLIPNIKNIESGNGLSVIESKQTHCIRGHLLPPSKGFGNGKRRNCPQCQAIRQRKYYSKHKHEINLIRRAKYYFNKKNPILKDLGVIP